MSILPTKDGSNTYISPIYHEAFHSRHGAISESQHVFIHNGLHEGLTKFNTELHVFEMGLGSGLNLLLTAMYCNDLADKFNVQYHAIEKHPLDWEVAKSLDFCKKLENTVCCTELFRQIHTSGWDTPIELFPDFSFRKIKGDILALDLRPDTYHLIYYDAFAPSAQPELWSEAICAKLFSILRSGGILTTYCAQGQFKRNLRSVGFEVEALPGPPGKREMTRALKS